MQYLGAALLTALSCSRAVAADAVVTLSPEDGALRAAFSLSTPVDRFAFESYYAQQRRDSWAPIGNDWIFDGGTLQRGDGALFTRFELKMSPDVRFYDRRYVVVDRLGPDGWALFLTAFRASVGSTEMRFADFPAEFVVRVGETLVDLTGTLSAGVADADVDELAYVGPARYVTEGPMTLIAGEDVPRWFQQRLLADTGVVVNELTRRFGVPPSTTPTLVITFRDDGGGGIVAGTLDHAVATFAIRRESLDEGDGSLVDEVASTAAHEAVHLWNGEIWRSAQNAEQSWLHEGAAEYLASRLTQDRESLRAEAEERLNACVRRSDRRPLDGSAGPVEAARYDCGFVIQLAAEAASVQAGAGDSFDLWRAVFAAADDGTYTAQAFLDEATRRGGAAFADLAAQMLASFDSLNWANLEQRLSAVGIEIDARSADAREAARVRSLALMPLLRSHCRGSYGFTTLEDRLVLDTGDRCGAALAGDPAVVSVNGVSLFAAPVEAHSSVRDRCSSGGEIVFGTLNGETLPPVRCADAIEPLPLVLDVRSLPALPDI